MSGDNVPAWADEPAPLTAARAQDGHYFTDQGSKMTLQSWEYELDPHGEVVPADFARCLEMRLRHALKLVNSLRIDAMHDTGHPVNNEWLEQQLSAIEGVLK